MEVGRVEIDDEVSRGSAKIGWRGREESHDMA